MSDPFRFSSSTDTRTTTATDDPGTAAPADAPHSHEGQPADHQQVQPDAAGATEPAAAGAGPAAAVTPSAAEARFQSCRWRKPETPPFCSHPEVLPFAGTNGFKPDAWCPGCAFYKLRRNPRRDY